MRNAEHYVDPTPSEALKNISKEEREVGILAHAMKDIAVLCGYEVVGRIVLKNKNSGNIYR